MSDERIITARHLAVTDGHPVEVPANAGVPTQLANPRRTTVRTIVQAIVGVLVVAVPLLNLVLAAVSDYLHKQTDVELPAWVFLAVNVGLAVTSFVIGLVARIMAVPGVAAFIAKYLPWLAPIKPS